MGRCLGLVQVSGSSEADGEQCLRQHEGKELVLVWELSAGYMSTEGL